MGLDPSHTAVAARASHVYVSLSHSHHIYRPRGKSHPSFNVFKVYLTVRTQRSRESRIFFQSESFDLPGNSNKMSNGAVMTILLI